MAILFPTSIESRRHQMFPTLEAAEIERVHRFGERRSYATGEQLAKTGDVSQGFMIILAGTVDVTQHHDGGPRELIVTHNMQQAARVSDFTAFMYLGELIEFDTTSKMFTSPSDRRTQDYITGRFG